MSLLVVLFLCWKHFHNMLLLGYQPLLHTLKLWFAKHRRLLAVLISQASLATPNSLTPILLFSFFPSATVNFTISPGRRAPRCVSWRSPWRWTANHWIASASSCMWPSGRSTCRSKRFFRTRWKKSWLLSGRKVLSLAALACRTSD